VVRPAGGREPVEKEQGILGRVSNGEGDHFPGIKYTSAGRAEARLGTSGGSRSSRAVMDVHLPDFGIENL